MSIVSIISSSLFVAFLSSLTIGIGTSVLKRLRFEHSYAVHVSVSYLIGLGVLGNIGLLLGLVGQFKVAIVYGIFASLWLLLHRVIYQAVLQLARALWQFVRETFSKSTIAAAVIIGLSVIVVLNYFACFLPPMAPDEVAYHNPEAQLLATSHSLQFPHGGHFFYGNIPLLMEIISAIGLLVQRYAIGHILQYGMYLALIVFCFGWLRRRYSFTTAVTGAAALFGLHEILYFSTTGYVDTADVVVQAVAILLAIDWLQRRDRSLLLVSGLLFGLALAIKYTALFTIDLIGLMLTLSYWFTTGPGKSLPGYCKTILNFIVPMLMVGGFWYVKNTWLYGNPFYPFYFGHVGVDEASYASMISAVQSFGFDRTFTNYVMIPLRYYWAYNQQVELQSLLVLVGLLTLPFTFVVKQYRRDHIFIFGYLLLFSIYWFFFATHITRFLHLPIVMLTLLGAVLVTNLSRQWRRAWLGLVVVTLFCLMLYYPKLNLTYMRKAIITIDPKPSPTEHWVYAPIRLDALLFVLGKLKASDY